MRMICKGNILVYSAPDEDRNTYRRADGVLLKYYQVTRRWQSNG